jgi:hypothetical protein
MLERYIRPAELSAAEVRQVLAFLNAAVGAEEIAAAVEFPDELDVGLGVAKRILDRRQALGGRFTTIDQLADVPFVGPERFTEIVAAITGRSLATGLTLDALWAEVRALRREVAVVAEARRTRITLERVEPEGYVGQPATLLLRVTTSGKPRVGARITVATTWGLLQQLVGFVVNVGRAINIGTDTRGEARVQLLSPLDDRLTEPQRQALIAVLGRLDRGARTPSQTLPGLQYMVDQYRMERSTALRGAIDLHFQACRAQLSDPINPWEPLAYWRREEALVLAYVQESGNAGGVASLASLVVPQKEWVAPWYRLSLRGLERGSGLREALDRGIRGLTDKSVLLERALTSVHSYVARQRGLAGEAAAQSAADHALRSFLADGMDELTPDTQLSMFSALDTAAKTIRGSGMGTLAAVNRARVDLRAEVESRTGGVEHSVNARVKGVESAVASTQDRLTEMQTDLGAMGERYDRFQRDYARFQTEIRGFSEDLAQFQTDRTQFQRDYVQFGQDYGKFDQTYRTFNQDYTHFSEDYSQFKIELSRVEPTGPTR